MKKIILSTAILISALNTTLAQLKEGSITYEVKMEGLPPEQAAMMDGSEQKTFFKNGKSRVEFSNAFVSSITINDNIKTIVLMEQMGQKFYFEMTDEDKKKADTKTPESVIEYKDETKKIAGYDCKKAIIKSTTEKGTEMTTTVWYTDQLPNAGQGASRGGASPMKNLKGAALEFEVQQGPYKMKYTATNVSTAPVADAKFIANTEGYVKKSLDEIRKSAGGK